MITGINGLVLKVYLYSFSSKMQSSRCTAQQSSSCSIPYFGLKLAFTRVIIDSGYSVQKEKGLKRKIYIIYIGTYNI